MSDEEIENLLWTLREDGYERSADLIESLQAENKRLRAALDDIANTRHVVRPRGRELGYGEDAECGHCLAWNALSPPEETEP